MNKQQRIIIIGLVLITFIFAKFIFWGSLLVSLFLSLSLVIIYFLGKRKNQLSTMISLIILWIDTFFLILLIVPTKAYTINTTWIYANRENYMKIYVKDKANAAKYMAILIWRDKDWQTTRKIIKLSDYKKWTKIKVYQWDKIYFIWKKENKSYAAIFLWDGTILRITPWTKLRLSKVFKNLNNLAQSQTKVKLEQWNIWFHVIKLIEGSKNMQIQTTTWQMLVIRWTAGLVSTNPENKTTYAVDYAHYIEAKNKIESKILQPGEWAIITDKTIQKSNLEDILNKVWISENILKTFPKLDQEDINKFKNEIIESIKEQIWWNNTISNIITKLYEVKYNLFSLWDNNYKKYLENLQTYQYLVWDNWKITNLLENNPNLAFIASNLQNQQAKLAYLYQQVKENIQNSDLYKTYIINLWISKKISNLSEKAIQEAINWKKFLENYFK